MIKNLSFADLQIKKTDRVLIFGYGNLGRQDDGLGIEFTERFANSKIANTLKAQINVDSNYQLNIEDALLISEFNVVLFVDASLQNKTFTPYGIRELAPINVMGISSHSMSPATVLSFCQHLYKKYPRCYLLTLPGYEWELKEELTAEAERNLSASLQDFTNCLEAIYA
jgi:hydrogenase maturation protease